MTTQQHPSRRFAAPRIARAVAYAWLIGTIVAAGAGVIPWTR